MKMIGATKVRGCERKTTHNEKVEEDNDGALCAKSAEGKESQHERAQDASGRKADE